MAKMKTVKNFGNQPIYLNLPGGRSLKIPARGEAEIEEADAASNELALHVSRGSAVVTEPESEGGQEAAGGEGDKEEKAPAEGQEPETQAGTGSQAAGKAKDEEGGKE